MAGFPLLIVIVAALAATALAAAGLHVFFRLLDSTTSGDSLASADPIAHKPTVRRD